jgi:hypothetical protein
MKPEPRRLRDIVERHRGLALTLVLLGGPVLALLAWDTAGHRRNALANRRLEVGMVRYDAMRTVGRAPDCIVRVARSEAWFFAADPATIACPGASSAAESLPRAYASLQVLIGPGGRVTAIAFDGEARLRTTRGDWPGSSLSELPQSHFD